MKILVIIYIKYGDRKLMNAQRNCRTNKSFLVSSVIPYNSVYVFRTNIDQPRGDYPSAEVQINANRIISVMYHFRRVSEIAWAPVILLRCISLHRHNKKLLINLMGRRMSFVIYIELRGRYYNGGGDKKLYFACIQPREIQKSNFARSRFTRYHFTTDPFGFFKSWSNQYVIRRVAKGCCASSYLWSQLLPRS